VYQETPRILEDFKQRIREEMLQITQYIPGNEFIFQRQLDEYLLRDGRYLADIIYKKLMMKNFFFHFFLCSIS